MNKRKKKKDYKRLNYLNIEKDILNEISSDNIIYEESQTGPQEEPILQEVVLNINKKSKKYKK